MKIVVIDGQGGRLGRRLVERIRAEFPDVDLLAVGVNENATESMLKGGATQVATGENAAVVACRNADIIVGPLGIAVANALMGEISPAISNAVSGSGAYRVLVPMNLCDTYVAGVTQSSTAIINDALDHIKKQIERINK